MATKAQLGLERPARDSLIGHRGGDGRAASFNPLEGITFPRVDGDDLPSFLKHVKLACNLDHPDRNRAVQVLKSLGSTWQVTKATMAEGSGMVGGYLLPTAISLQLLKSLAEQSFNYPRALTVPMTTHEVQAPIFDLSQGSAGQSPFVGGMAFNWQGVGIPETEPTFGNVSLLAWNLIGYTRMSNQVLSDMGPEAEGLLVQLFAMAAAVQFEYGCMQGTGTANNMPLGIINSPCAVKVARAAPNAVAAADVEAMAGHMIPRGWRKGIWTVNPSALPQLFGITQFTPNFPGDGSNEGCCGFLYTRPVFPTEKAPALGKTGDLCFWDPSIYVIGMRTDVLVSASEHSRFQNNQTEFMVVLRGDGKPLMNNSVTLMDGSTNASMVVVLQ
jgi:HK97 family phage major capsid protein